ncbi:hypothetical protein [Paracoccus sp. S-4012]|uniref:hypothetical protein n=1 Tax=Paracoccus sp. S-4012 TaxID=2665648 RepID=UPI0018A22EE5|nr:hypothetical protein [Paracoccus sp. S-4012]
MRLLKVLVVLVVLAVAGLAGYAYLGDMAPERRETRVPITLGEGGAVAGRPVSVTAASPADAPPTEDAAAVDAPPPVAAGDPDAQLD